MSNQSDVGAVPAPLAHEPLTQDGVGDLARMFKALGDPVRLRLRLLSMVASHTEGEACVCDLTPAFDLFQPTISHHLKVLRAAGLLECADWPDARPRRAVARPDPGPRAHPSPPGGAAEATPVREAAHLHADLARGGITSTASVLNQSLAATHPSDPVLAARAAGEHRYLTEAATRTDRLAALPRVARSPVGPEQLRALTATPVPA